MYFLPIMTIITKIFPQIPKIKDTNIITAPVYIAPCDGPIALDWFKVTFVWFNPAVSSVNSFDIL